MGATWKWITSFATIARGIVLCQIEGYDKRYPTTAKESLFAYPYGLRPIIICGSIVRPIPKPWNWGNPWTLDDHRWFVLRIPFPVPQLIAAAVIAIVATYGGWWWLASPLVFLSAFVSVVTPGNRGAYVGAKCYTVDKAEDNPRYGWARDDEDGHVYACPSLSIRSTAVD